MKYLKSKGLLKKERSVLAYYNHFWYKVINEDIKTWKVTSDSMHLSMWLHKLDQYYWTVFRGDKLSHHEWNKYYANLKVWDVYTYQPFMSTSYSKEFIDKFAISSQEKPISIKMQIVSKTWRYTSNSEEKEILFDKGTTFKVQWIKSTKDYHLFYLEEIWQAYGKQTKNYRMKSWRV